MLIPLGGPLTQELTLKVKKFLATHLPQWTDVRIASCGEYLGFWIGPSIKDKMWNKPESKWDSRSRDIAAAKLAPSLGVQQYNARAVTTMSYVAQLYPLSNAMMKNEKSVIQNIFHVLNNTFPVPLIFQMKNVKVPQPDSLLALSFAARYRAATKTLTTWRANLDELNACRSEHAPLNWFVGRAHSSPWWDTPPIADLVADAFYGFGERFGNLDKTISHARKVSPRIGIQGAAVKIMTPQLYPLDVAQELARRIRLWLPSSRNIEDLPARISTSLNALASTRPVFVLSVLLTWCNGWTTSARTSSETRTCLLGCNDKDSLLHYIGCPPLWGELLKLEGLPTVSSVEDNIALSICSLTTGTAKTPARAICLASALDAFNNLKAMRNIPTDAAKQQLRESYRRLKALAT